jgi:hypothetical protein
VSLLSVIQPLLFIILEFPSFLSTLSLPSHPSHHCPLPVTAPLSFHCPSSVTAPWLPKSSLVSFLSLHLSSSLSFCHSSSSLLSFSLLQPFSHCPLPSQPSLITFPPVTAPLHYCPLLPSKLPPSHCPPCHSSFAPCPVTTPLITSPLPSATLSSLSSAHGRLL